jgi:hypothetical protein
MRLSNAKINHLANLVMDYLRTEQGVEFFQEDGTSAREPWIRTSPRTRSPIRGALQIESQTGSRGKRGHPTGGTTTEMGKRHKVIPPPSASRLVKSREAVPQNHDYHKPETSGLKHLHRLQEKFAPAPPVEDLWDGREDREA